MAITNTQIKKWNETFKKASKPEKKILIAKDVLANIKSKKYIASHGNYFNNLYELSLNIGKNNDIQENFDKIENCECCALGACLISSTKYQNKLTFDDLGYGSSTSNSWLQLKSIFTPREMAIIESCFEGFDTNACRVATDKFYYELDSNTGIKCQDFHDDYIDDEERLVAICKNIIKNKGFIKI